MLCTVAAAHETANSRSDPPVGVVQQAMWAKVGFGLTVVGRENGMHVDQDLQKDVCRGA